MPAINGGSLGVIILAAGQGTRMKSALPKVLHPVCGTPMVGHILSAAAALQPLRIAVVVGYGADEMRTALAGSDVSFVEQTELLGTADAVKRCHEAMTGCDKVFVLNGDSPLITTQLLERLLAAGDTASMAFATTSLDDPRGLGRVNRDSAGVVTGIIEAADYRGPAGPAEINAGQYLFDAPWLWSRITSVPKSPKGEFYLTHLLEIAHRQGRPAIAVEADADEVLGVDDRLVLARAEKLMRTRILERHMLDGVTIVDPDSTYIDAEATIAADVTILPRSHVLGRSFIARGSVLGPGSVLRSATIGEDCEVDLSVIEDSRIGDRVHVGPFSRLRAGVDLGDDCFLGNYAEMKNAKVGPRVKMHHFGFMGDADIGADSNIAAGAITCNYDGLNKNRTVIGERVFIGCDTMLIAPVTIGDDALTAAGSVVNRDVAAGERVAGVPIRTLAGRPPPGSSTGAS